MGILITAWDKEDDKMRNLRTLEGEWLKCWDMISGQHFNTVQHDLIPRFLLGLHSYYASFPSLYSSQAGHCVVLWICQLCCVLWTFAFAILSTWNTISEIPPRLSLWFPQSICLKIVLSLRCPLAALFISPVHYFPTTYSFPITFSFPNSHSQYPPSLFFSWAFITLYPTNIILNLFSVSFTYKTRGLCLFC